MPGPRVTTLLVAAVASLGCQAGDELVAPAVGALRITIEQSGSPPDPDGISVTVDSGAGRAVSSDAPVLLTDLTIGSHTLAVDGVAPGCALDGPNPRSVTVVTDSTVPVVFLVACSEPPETGMLLVTVLTGGANRDPDGYDVYVDALEPKPLADGDTVAFVGVVAGSHLVRLGGAAGNCNVVGDDPRPAEVPAGGTLVVPWEVNCWPPVAGRIAFTRTPLEASGRHLYLVNADGTGLTQLGFDDTDFDDDPVWSPDGSRIAVMTQSSDVDTPVRLRIVTADGDVRLLPIEPLFAFGIRWAPDGSRLSFEDFDGDNSQFHVYLIAADGTGTYHRLATIGSEAGGGWSPDGNTIAFYGGESYKGPHRLYLTQSAGGTPRAVTADTLALDAEGADLEWSPDGRHIVFVGPQALGAAFGSDIYIVAADGTGLRNLTGSPPFTTNTEPRWSPDGRRIAFICSIPLDQDSNLGDVCAVAPDGGPVVKLTDSPATTEGLHWSPDGSRLVFARPDSTDRFLGRPDLFVMNADGSGLVRLTRSPDDEESPSWGR